MKLWKILWNPSSTHSFGRDSKSIIELTRKNIAKELKIKANEVYFTSGGTESNNMIFHSAINFHGIERIISTKIEHKAVLKCIDTYSILKILMLCIWVLMKLENLIWKSWSLSKKW